MQLFYAPQLANKQYFLDEDESRHCIKVLRKQKGDKIECIDGLGNFYTCEISEANPKKCTLKIVAGKTESPLPYYLHIAIAPTKNTDRMEWFVEKAVEIGISEISFVHCNHSERSNLKIERLQRKVIAAMKQSIKASQPKLNELVKFKDFVMRDTADTDKYIAYVDFANPQQLKDSIKGNKVCILIGPEGDFSEEEIALAISVGYQKTGLGRSRLRTETAGIVACSTVANHF